PPWPRWRYPSGCAGARRPRRGTAVLRADQGEQRLPEGVGEAGLRDRTTGELLREAARRIAERDRRCGRDPVGNLEQLLHLRLDRAEERRERRAEPLGAGRQDEVLDARVDRRAADEAQAIEVAVG